MEKNTHFHKGIKILAIIGSAFLILIIGIFIFLKLTFLKTFPTFRGEVEIGKWYDVPVKSAGGNVNSKCEKNIKIFSKRQKILIEHNFRRFPA